MAQSDPIFIQRYQIQLGPHFSRQGFKAGFWFHIVYSALFVSLWEEAGPANVLGGIFIGFRALFRSPRRGGPLNSENWCSVNKMEVLSQNEK